jgi:hypothetical protein
MSLVNEIASYSSAQAMTEVKNAAAIKVAKMAQEQNQVAADLLTSAVEDVQEMMQESSGDVGNNLDCCG